MRAKVGSGSIGKGGDDRRAGSTVGKRTLVEHTEADEQGVRAPETAPVAADTAPQLPCLQLGGRPLGASAGAGESRLPHLQLGNGRSAEGDRGGETTNTPGEGTKRPGPEKDSGGDSERRALEPTKKKRRVADGYEWASKPDRISGKAGNEIVELKDGTTVITEFFTCGHTKRRRQIELRIPFATLRGEAAKKFTEQGATTPLPLLSRFESKRRKVPKYKIDRTANEQARYDIGHLMPSKSSAPKNAWLYTYMTAQTNQINQSRSWKRSELKIDRMLGIPQGSKAPSKPRKAREARIAHLASPVGPFRDGYKKIQLFYAATETRIPSHFLISLHNANGRCFKRFSPIQNTRVDHEPQQPSKLLQECFVHATRLLKQADAKTAKSGRKQCARHLSRLHGGLEIACELRGASREVCPLAVPCRSNGSPCHGQTSRAVDFARQRRIRKRTYPVLIGCSTLHFGTRKPSSS
jgi:hypothetical protein